MFTTHNDFYKNNKTIFGFWLYIMSDCILFATLFATHAVLSNNSISLHSNKIIFNLPFIFLETCCLLFSSLSYAIATIYTKKLHIKKVIFWMVITILLGICFIYMEFQEFHHLMQIGHHPNENAFFSSFFTLVGTHGLHVIAGIIWMIVMIMHLIYRGITYNNQIRLQCLGLFWHFLDIIWICVFTEIYLIGAM